MNQAEILKLAGRLVERGEPFAMASVVARTAPSSARRGWRALVEADGTFHGWLGGACVEPTVRREAVEALRDGRPRLLVFSPDGEADRPGATVYPMTCHSGGSVEVYIEPELPAPILTLFGDSPVTRALAAMGTAAGYRLQVVGVEDATAYGEVETLERLDPASESAGGDTGDGGSGGAATRRFAVVATMGEWDEDAVRQALRAGSSYVGLVASPRRAEELRSRLESQGVTPGNRLAAPAGLDLGAREPEEIAVTILAEIVQRRRAGVEEPSIEAGREQDLPPRPEEEKVAPAPPAAAAAGAVPGDGGGGRDGGGDAAAGQGAGGQDAAAVAEDRTVEPVPADGFRVDPVCGMKIPIEAPSYQVHHEDTYYFFCCSACQSKFKDDPEFFLAEEGAGEGA